MSISNKIFYKVFTLGFYRANASLFFISAGLIIGLMRSEDHLALAEVFISSGTMLTIPISFWVIYSILVIKYNRDEMRNERNNFILDSAFLTNLSQFGIIASALLYQFFPIIFYAAFLVTLAILHGNVEVVLIVVVSILLLMLIATWFLWHSFNRPNFDREQTVLEQLVHRKFTRPFSFFSIEWIVRRVLFVLIGVKLFSLLLLYCIAALYSTENYDLRLLIMGVVICCAVQIGLIQQIHRFDNYDFQLYRNLPITLPRKLVNLFFSISILFLPEMGLILSADVFNNYFTVQAIFFLISIPILFYGLMFKRQRSQEELITISFFISMTWILLILFKAPVILLGLINFSMGVWYIHCYGYFFEFHASE